jgi:lysophospholipase L1-like esterase
MESKMAVILCYGDSNTHGTKPVAIGHPAARYARGIPWTDVMGAMLGQDHFVIVEGLPGRTTVHDDPIDGGVRSGIAVLPAILLSHEPLDLLVLMLGTNDLKQRFSSSSLEIAKSVDRIVKEARWHIPALDILIVSPTSISLTDVTADMFAGADSRQIELTLHLERVAQMNETDFLSADNHVKVSPIDGVHWDQKSHRTFGNIMAVAVLARLAERGLLNCK